MCCPVQVTKLAMGVHSKSVASSYEIGFEGLERYSHYTDRSASNKSKGQESTQLKALSQ